MYVIFQFFEEIDGENRHFDMRISSFQRITLQIIQDVAESALSR